MTSDGIVAGDTGETRRPDVARIAMIAVAAFLSLLGAIRYGVHAETVVVIFVIWTLVVISRHDFERRIIPNRIVAPLTHVSTGLSLRRGFSNGIR